MDGDTNQLRDQMASGTAVNCVQLGTGNTALFLAVLHDKLEAASFLLDSGAEFKLDNLGRTPLYVASSALAVDLLVAAGASVNAQDKDDNTPLHTTKVAEVAQALLAAGADASLRNRQGCTALEVALEMWGTEFGGGWLGVRKPQVAAIIRAHQGISDGPLGNLGTSSFALPGVSARALPDVSEAAAPAAPGASVPAPVPEPAPELPPASAEPSSDDAVRDAVPRPEALARMSRAELECRIVATRQALTALEGELCRRRQDDQTCVICMDKTMNTAFVPCGHQACAECAATLTTCHSCRSVIDQRLRLFA